MSWASSPARAARPAPGFSQREHRPTLLRACGWRPNRACRTGDVPCGSKTGEPSTLAAAGIAAILTAKTDHAAVLANGNQIADKGGYVRADGTAGDLVEVTGDLADIDLAENPFYSEFTDPAPLTAEAQALPDIAGSGAVRDLREAANDAVCEMSKVG
jgi:hypothetical protein